MRDAWTLDPDIVFLNHGSFGACPKVVLEEQNRLRSRLEAEPVRFMVRELPVLHAQARTALGAFIGADAEELALLPNATTAVNAVVRSLPLQPGDEILVTDHEYNACRNVADFVAARRGAVVRTASIPYPVASPEDALAPLVEALTDRTRLVMVDHITSSTALVFPVEALASLLEERGIDFLIDGAHAPGQVPFDLRRLPKAFYTGNAHKWLCTPKGSAFLRVPRDRQHEIRPAVISHGANAPTGRQSRFRQEFDWCGTDDPTPYLCLPAALDFMEKAMPGGFPAVMQRNHELVVEGRRILTDALGLEPPAPESMLGSMASLTLPARVVEGELGAWDMDPLQERLLDEEQIEVPLFPWPAPGQRQLRISAQLYNTRDDYLRLASALTKLL
ncbi:MAG TPA: aminotransferase class V-fold PLP-dependent enzyme [Planctomycetes bacterium]|nr:aminotransferase class V-fold PLP-dependent enzyme [Planctomycetota bacterium]